MALSLPVSFCNVTLNLVPQLTAQFSGCQLKKKIKKTEKSHCQKNPKNPKTKKTPDFSITSSKEKPLVLPFASDWYFSLTGGMRLWQQWDVTNSGTIAGAENEGDKKNIYIWYCKSYNAKPIITQKSLPSQIWCSVQSYPAVWICLCGAFSEIQAYWSFFVTS